MIRLKRQSGYMDKIRKYKIFMDGVNIGEINDGEMKELNGSPGKHTIHLSIDWCKSNKLEITLKENEVLELECGNSMKGFEILLSYLYITILKNSYLWISEKNIY